MSFKTGALSSAATTLPGGDKRGPSADWGAAVGGSARFERHFQIYPVLCDLLRRGLSSRGNFPYGAAVFAPIRFSGAHGYNLGNANIATQ